VELSFSYVPAVGYYRSACGASGLLSVDICDKRVLHQSFVK
jgi:hypothetical protein